MSKKFFLSVVLCLSVGTLFCAPGESKYSKSQSDGIFTMGPQLSLLFTDIHFNSQIKAGFTSGFGVGVFFRIGGVAHFQPEIAYSLKKFAFNPTFPELEGNPKFSTHYLSFTPMLGVSVINNDDFKFRIFFGPEGGMHLKNNYVGNHNPFTKFEFGGKIGIGFDVYNATVDIGYRYLMSKNSEISKIQQEYQRQNMIFVSVGYCIF